MHMVPDFTTMMETAKSQGMHISYFDTCLSNAFQKLCQQQTHEFLTEHLLYTRHYAISHLVLSSIAIFNFMHHQVKMKLRCVTSCVRIIQVVNDRKGVEPELNLD